MTNENPTSTTLYQPQQQEDERKPKQSLCCLSYRKIVSLLSHYVVIDKTSEVNYHWKSSIYDDFVEESYHTGIVVYLNLDRLAPRLRLYLISILPRRSDVIGDTTSMMFVDGSVMGFARRPRTPSLKCQGSITCTNEALKVCSLCKEVRYCSRKCQLTDWSDRHYITCNNGWIKTLAPTNSITFYEQEKDTIVKKTKRRKKKTDDQQRKEMKSMHQDHDPLHNVVSELRQLQLG